MSDSSSTHVSPTGGDTPTDWLLRATAGNGAAVERMFPLVYDELRRLAHRYLCAEAAGHTLTTTDLVHEAYLRLVDGKHVECNDRAHFLRVAAVAMRRILVDHARSHRSVKRGSAATPISLDRLDVPAQERAAELLALDEALTRLAHLDARQAQIVECRFFGGMTEEETAAALGIGLRSAKRDWAKARSWLFLEIYADSQSPLSTRQPPRSETAPEAG